MDHLAARAAHLRRHPNGAAALDERGGTDVRAPSPVVARWFDSAESRVPRAGVDRRRLARSGPAARTAEAASDGDRRALPRLPDPDVCRAGARAAPAAVARTGAGHV